MAASLEDPTAHLNRLKLFSFSDDQPAVESPASSIAYTNINNLNFADEKAYSHTVQYFSKETLYMARLVSREWTDRVATMCSQ
jgi:hypothetical protein